MARLKLFGKSPAGLYLRVNRRIWQILSRVLRAYGAWLHSLVCLHATRRQFFGTFFLRNRPALELAPSGGGEGQRLDFENCRARLQHRRRGLLNPLDHPFGATGPESLRVRGG